MAQLFIVDLSFFIEIILPVIVNLYFRIGTARKNSSFFTSESRKPYELSFFYLSYQFILQIARILTKLSSFCLCGNLFLFRIHCLRGLSPEG